LAERRVAVEDEAKIPTNNVRIGREHFANPIQCSGEQRAVRVKEEQHLATRRRRTDADPLPATGRRGQSSDPMTARDFERSVLTTAIHHDHLVFRPLSTDRVEQRRK
jgi:hypothetical protein